MPVISMFYGIITRMFLLNTQNHNLPHLHASYPLERASEALNEVLSQRSSGKVVLIP